MSAPAPPGQLSPESVENSLPLAGVQGPVIRWPTKVSLYNNKQQQQVALLIVAENLGQANEQLISAGRST